MSEEIKHDYITYTEYAGILNKMIYAIQEILIKHEGIKFTHVYGPKRGGMPIAIHISHQLELEFLDRLEDNVLEIPMKTKPYILIVDDVCDSGKTLSEIHNYLNDFEIPHKTATLHIKPRCKDVIVPDIFVYEFSNNTWIHYPWEKTEDEPDKDYMFK